MVVDYSSVDGSLLLMGFKLMAGAVASCALIGVAVGVGIIYGSLLISIGRNPSQRDELLRYAFIGFSLVEVSGLIGLVISLLLLFGFDWKRYSSLYSFTAFTQLPNRETELQYHGIYQQQRPSSWQRVIIFNFSVLVADIHWLVLSNKSNVDYIYISDLWYY